MFANQIDVARALAMEFATQLNNTPNDAENWRALNDNDDLPDGDYTALRQQFGEVTRDMERAYKSAFNSVFIPVGNGE